MCSQNMHIIMLLVVCCSLEIAELLRCPETELVNGTAKKSRTPKRLLVHYKCNKNFKLIGANFAFCRSGVWSAEVPLCVATTCPMPETTLGVIVEKLYSGGVLSFTCQPGLVRVGPQRIKCLEGRWDKQPPVCAPIMSMNCDFEHKDLCGWSQTTEDEFDWIWHQGSTPTPNSGPLNDHTLNSSSGHYLFIESSSPQKFGDRARLLSPTYSRGTVDGMCLQFYYHMFGPDSTGEVGNLDVYIFARSANASNNDATELLFHREGNQGDDWTVAEVYIPLKDTTVQLAFQATRLNGFFGDIAIDDVKIHNCTQGPELTVSTAMRANNNTTRETATERTPPLRLSSTSSKEREVISSSTHRNDTLIDAERMKAVTTVTTVSTSQSNTTDKPIKHNVFSHTYVSSDKTQMVNNFLSHAYPPSDKTLTTTNVLYNDFVNDHQNESSDNREGHTFETRHTIILNIIVLIAAVVAASRLTLSWLRHRRHERFNQRQEGHKTSCHDTVPSKKWAEAYV